MCLQICEILEMLEGREGGGVGRNSNVTHRLDEDKVYLDINAILEMIEI